MQLLQSIHAARWQNRWSALLTATLCGLFCQLCMSQTFTSSITGAVTDPSGAAVTGAKIEVRNLGTNDVREFTSQADGSYQINNL